MLDGGRPVLARSQYVVLAPRQRVWDLLASTIIQCLPVEQMQIVNDTTFVGVLKLKLGLFEVPMRLNVRAADISPIDSLSTVVTATKGLFQSSFKVSFALAAAGEERTSVACTATEEGRSRWTWLLRRQQRNFSAAIFDSIRDELQRSC